MCIVLGGECGGYNFSIVYSLFYALPGITIELTFANLFDCVLCQEAMWE